MVTKPEELKWWWFDAVEEARDVWRVTGIDQQGRSVSRSGIDLDEVLRQCYEDALSIQRGVDAMRRRKAAGEEIG